MKHPMPSPKMPLSILFSVRVLFAVKEMANQLPTVSIITIKYIKTNIRLDVKSNLGIPNGKKGGRANHEAFVTEEKSVSPIEDAMIVVIIIAYKTPPLLSIFDIGSFKLPITINVSISKKTMKASKTFLFTGPGEPIRLLKAVNIKEMPITTTTVPATTGGMNLSILLKILK